jgi:hypothetical protein
VLLQLKEEWLFQSIPQITDRTSSG